MYTAFVIVSASSIRRLNQSVVAFLFCYPILELTCTLLANTCKSCAERYSLASTCDADHRVLTCTGELYVSGDDAATQTCEPGVAWSKTDCTYT